MVLALVALGVRLWPGPDNLGLAIWRLAAWCMVLPSAKPETETKNDAPETETENKAAANQEAEALNRDREGPPAPPV